MVFYDLNGLDLKPPSVDEAVELVVAVAAGHVELDKLSERLASWTGRQRAERVPRSSRARTNTPSSISSVNLLVLVFCCHN